MRQTVPPATVADGVRNGSRTSSPPAVAPWQFACGFALDPNDAPLAITSLLAAILLVTIVVAVHYEVLHLLHGRLQRVSRKSRGLLIQLILGAIAGHVLEVWIFGCGMWFASKIEPEIHLIGEGIDGSLVDFFYFAAVSYTTVGFGDILPSPQLRLLTVAAAITGLVCVTWTASLSYLHMQRLWKDTPKRH